MLPPPSLQHTPPKPIHFLLNPVPHKFLNQIPSTTSLHPTLRKPTCYDHSHQPPHARYPQVNPLPALKSAKRNVYPHNGARRHQTLDAKKQQNSMRVRWYVLCYKHQEHPALSLWMHLFIHTQPQERNHRLRFFQTPPPPQPPSLLFPSKEVSLLEKLGRRGE